MEPVKATGASSKKWLGWHFLKTPGVLRDRTAAATQDGGLEQISGYLEICSMGLHASKDAADALKYNPGGFTLRRVELLGERQDRDDKSAALQRKVLFTLEASKVEAVVKEWACWCAEQALALVEDDTEEKQVAILAGLLAVEVARERNAGLVDRETAYAAHAAAHAAAYAAYAAYAAHAAAHAAAYAAADAAYDAAYDAADAAYAAAYAAHAAADAAYAEARQAMQKRIRRELEKRLMALRGSR